MNAVYKRVLAVAILALMIAVPLAVLSQESAEAAPAEPVDYSKYYYNQLDDNAKVIYDNIIGLMASGTNSFTVSAGVVFPEYADKNLSEIMSGGNITVSSSTIRPAVSAAKYDNPRLYWTDFSTSMGLEGYPNQPVSSATMTITMNLIAGIPMNATGDVAIESVIASAIDNGDLVVTGTMLQKVKGIHDYLTHKLSYASDALATETSTSIPNHLIRSTYTAFTGDQVVCEGYAKAFKYLCDKYGIPCVMVAGVAKNSPSSPGEGHLWNRVLVDDKWYTVDVTWDDPVGSGSNERDSYFLVGSNTIVDDLAIKDSHLIISSEDYCFTPPAPESASSYYGDKFTVILNYYNGSGNYDVVEVDQGTPMAKPEDPVAEGLTFLAWYSDPELKTLWNFANPVTGDMTLYAKWEGKIKANVTYWYYTGSETVYTAYVGDNYQISSATPMRDGYLFKEWNTASNGSGTTYHPGDIFTVPNHNVTLYAIWSIVCTVTFDPNGGTGAAIAPIEVAQGGTITLPAPSLTKQDYKFGGWSTSSGATVASNAANSTYKVTSDVKFYAVWMPKCHLSYDVNGGDVKISDSADAYAGESVKVTDKVPVHIGYVFKGWNTSSDGKGVTYQSGSNITLTADTTLYAMWKSQAAEDAEEKAKDMANDLMTQVTQGLDDFGKDTEQYLGKPWIEGIANVYVVIIGAIAALAIAAMFVRKH